MPKVSEAHYHKMKNSYRHDVAKALASFAMLKKLVTYGELSSIFGGSPRGWGDVLGGIAIRCNDAKLPLLSVIVVNASTRKPSVDAVLYEDLRLGGPESISEEQQRCFEYNWLNSQLEP